VAELIWRIRQAASPRAQTGDFWFVVLVGGGAAIILGASLTVSLQAACALTLVALVIALYEWDRSWGVTALFGLWFLAPGIRRVLGELTGYVDSDPLSLAPFLATGAIAALELVRLHVPTNIRRIVLMASIGFALGLPVGFVNGPRSAVFAFLAYVAALSAAVIGIGERTSVQDSVLRRVLLFGMLPIALYGLLQRVLGLPHWDQAWIDATDFSSIGIQDATNVRVFASLNSPGTMAGLLGLSLLCYLTIQRPRWYTICGAALITVALSLTYVRSSWVALPVAGLAHVLVSNGRSARLVFGAGAVIVAATLALAPVNDTAHDVLNRFKSITNFQGDQSSNERRATFKNTFPSAAATPQSHGLGSAGEPSKLSGDSNLRAPDNGYLSLIYQTGPAGFILVMAAVGIIFAAAWRGARIRAPGQELRWLLFAMFVYLLVLDTAGDEFYGVQGMIFWFIGGQVLAYDFRHRAATS
jgi:hypothetical protein